MIKVLFVCLGNICRSPLGEGIFKHLVKKRGLEGQISCDSAGTGNYHVGADPDQRSIKVALKYQITLDHKGRQFMVKDFDDFDYILAMDQSNFQNIMKLQRHGEIHGKVFLMRNFDPEKELDEDVPDPYYGEVDGFEVVYSMLLRSCSNFLDYLIKKHKLNAAAEGLS